MRVANPYLKAVLAGYALLSITLAYLLISFVAWSWNVGEWDTGARALLVIFTLIIMSAFLPLYERLRKDINSNV